MVEFFRKEDAEQSQLKDLDLAVATGKWMTAIFHVDDDGAVMCRRTTFDFPKAKFEDCVEALRKNLKRETDGVLPDDPLPVSEMARRDGPPRRIMVPDWYRKIAHTGQSGPSTSADESEVDVPDDLRPQTVELDGGDVE